MYAWAAEWKGKQFGIKMLPMWLFDFALLMKEKYDDMREQFKTMNVVETMPIIHLLIHEPTCGCPRKKK